MTKKEQNELQAKAKELVEQLNKEKKMYALHHHPNTITRSLAELVDMAEDEPTKFLFEDCVTLVNIALEKTKLVPPPTKREDAN